MAGRTGKQTVKMHIFKNFKNRDIETSFIDNNAFGYQGQFMIKRAFSYFVTAGAYYFKNTSRLI